MTEIAPSLAEVLELCKVAWAKKVVDPQVIVTFSTGGLFVTGLMLKAGMLKVPCYALPWTRKQVDGKWVAEGLDLVQTISPAVMGRTRRFAIVDDVFDSGCTVGRALVELNRFQWARKKRVIQCFAPYAKTCFDGKKLTPCKNGPLEVHIGKIVDEQTWIKFAWEV